MIRSNVIADSVLERRAPLLRVVVGALMACVLVVAPGCDGGPSDPPVDRLPPAAADPTNGWSRATPAQVGISESRIRDLAESLRRNPGGMRSLLIVRDGYLVTEEYFNGKGPDVLHTLRSVTKSVTALTAGVAAQRGRLVGNEVVLPCSCCTRVCGADGRSWSQRSWRAPLPCAPRPSHAGPTGHGATATSSG